MFYVQEIHHFDSDRLLHLSLVSLVSLDSFVLPSSTNPHPYLRDDHAKCNTCNDLPKGVTHTLGKVCPVLQSVEHFGLQSYFAAHAHGVVPDDTGKDEGDRE